MSSLTAAELRAWLDAHGWSAARLAAEIPRPERTVYDWLAGRTIPPELPAALETYARRIAGAEPAAARE